MPETNNLSIVDPEEAMTHLRLDSADEPWLRLTIPAVEHTIVLWCGGKSRLLDDNGELHECVKLAALTELARVHVQREGPYTTKTITWFMRGYSLGPGATALLQPLRKPTVA